MKDMEQFKEGLLTLIEKCFGPTTKEAPPVEQITKSVNEEQRLALFVVLEPQEGEYTKDLHGDTYTADEIRKGCYSFNTHCRKANLFHAVELEDAHIVESYITPVDMSIDGKVIKSGTWLQTWYFPETEIGEELWSAVKSGEINGVSINCKALGEEIND